MYIHQPIYDIPDFEQVTAEKLAHYYIVCQRAVYEVGQRLDITSLAPIYETAQRDYHSDPVNNPTSFPEGQLTVEVVKGFYEKCDAICRHASSNNTTTQLLRIVMASTAGAQFIGSVILQRYEHPSFYKITRAASDKATEAFSTPEQLRAMMGSRDPTHAHTANPGDIFSYIDANQRKHRIRVKDHGSSAMRGEFYIITTIIDRDEDLEGKYDREVTLEEMEQIVRNRSR